mmetsp:Transcript_25862/g.60651  ORF Transcript_25862/g.60651 Transcript_25862/m.60651 type:complete len:364 (-) Transcript_25862:280-1371(-)
MEASAGGGGGQQGFQRTAPVRADQHLRPAGSGAGQPERHERKPRVGARPIERTLRGGRALAPGHEKPEGGDQAPYRSQEERGHLPPGGPSAGHRTERERRSGSHDRHAPAGTPGFQQGHQGAERDRQGHDGREGFRRNRWVLQRGERRYEREPLPARERDAPLLRDGKAGRTHTGPGRDHPHGESARRRRVGQAVGPGRHGRDAAEDGRRLLEAAAPGAAPSQGTGETTEHERRVPEEHRPELSQRGNHRRKEGSATGNRDRPVPDTGGVQDGHRPARQGGWVGDGQRDFQRPRLQMVLSASRITTIRFRFSNAAAIGRRRSIEIERVSRCAFQENIQGNRFGVSFLGLPVEGHAVHVMEGET